MSAKKRERAAMVFDQEPRRGSRWLGGDLLKFAKRKVLGKNIPKNSQSFFLWNLRFLIYWILQDRAPWGVGRLLVVFVAGNRGLSVAI